MAPLIAHDPMVPEVPLVAHVELIPELSLPLNQGVFEVADMVRAARAMFASGEYLRTFGGGAPVTEQTKQQARDVLLDKKPVSTVQNSAVARHLVTLLDDYDHNVVQSYAQIRQFVTNSLLEEAAPGSKGRIRALELLGKISGVDLFTERSEITVRHQTTDELEAMVREKLNKLSIAAPDSVIQDVPFVEHIPAGTTLAAEEVPEVRDNPMIRAEMTFNAITGRN